MGVVINSTKLQQINNDKRKVEIQNRLLEIDNESLRALRAKVLNKNTKQDDDKLLTLELEADTLRTEYGKL